MPQLVETQTNPARAIENVLLEREACLQGAGKGRDVTIKLTNGKELVGYSSPFYSEKLPGTQHILSFKGADYDFLYNEKGKCIGTRRFDADANQVFGKSAEVIARGDELVRNLKGATINIGDPLYTRCKVLSSESMPHTDLDEKLNAIKRHSGKVSINVNVNSNLTSAGASSSKVTSGEEITQSMNTKVSKER